MCTPQPHLCIFGNNVLVINVICGMSSADGVAPRPIELVSDDVKDAGCRTIRLCLLHLTTSDETARIASIYYNDTGD
jgi:hypothetical protein